jgi:hypothetical protein
MKVRSFKENKGIRAKGKLLLIGMCFGSVSPAAHQK